MKRRIILFFLIAVLLTLAVRAADPVTVRLDALGMSIDVPADYYIFTRNMDPDDPALEAKGIDNGSLQQMMEQSDIYLDLLNDDTAMEILVTMQPNALDNMSIFDEATLDGLKAPLTQEYESAGMTVRGVDRISTDQTVFFRTEGSMADVQIVVYYTVYNYQAISMVLRYQGETIPETLRTQMQAMVDSVRFDGAAAQNEDISEAEAEADVEAGAEEVVLYESFDYEDDEHGVRFTVPEGWAEIPAEDMGVDGVIAVFSAAENHDATIYYEWNDMVEKVPAISEMLDSIPGFERIDINQESLNIDDIASGISGDVTDTRVETIGDREFYVFDISYENGTNETLAVRIENGYSYNFGFVRINGADCDAQYPDFVALVKSAELPEVEAPAALIEPAEAEPEEPEAPAPEKKKGIPILPIALGGAAAGGIIGFVVSRNKKKRAAAQQPTYAVPATPFAPTAPTAPVSFASAAVAGAAAPIAQAAKPAAPVVPAVPVVPDAPVAPTKRVCAACGADLAPGETVCPYCGTKAE